MSAAFFFGTIAVGAFFACWMCWDSDSGMEQAACPLFFSFGSFFAILTALVLTSCGKPPPPAKPTTDPITFVCGKLTECALVNDDRESQRGCRICGAMYLELIRVDYHLTDAEIFDVLGAYDCEEASKSYVLRRALECISE